MPLPGLPSSATPSKAGVQIDRTRYHVFYEGFASNIIPDITVIPAQEQEGKTDE